MTDNTLPTHLLIDGARRTAQLAGVPMLVVQRGDPDRGSIVLRTNLLDGTCRIWEQARDAEGRPGWLALGGGAAMPLAAGDALCARLIARDRDLWLLEADDREGRLWFAGLRLDSSA